MKEKIFKACLLILEKEGWKEFSFAKAAENSDLPLAAFQEYFSTPSDVMIHLLHLIDQEALKEIKLLDSLPPKDALFEIFMTRFEVATPYKKIIQNFVEEYAFSIEAMPSLVAQGFSSTAKTLEMVGFSSCGFKGFLRLQGLVIISLMTLRVWLADETPDLGKTMSFLDKSLSRAETLAAVLTSNFMA